MRRSTALLLVGVSLLAVRCGPAGETIPRQTDLVTGADARRASMARPPTRVTCADLNQFSVVLASGEEFNADVTLLDRPRLVVSGCSPAERPGVPAASGNLRITVTGASGREVSSDVTLDPAHGWWTTELDLGALAGDKAHIRLGGDPSRGAVFVRDLYVLHDARVPERTARPPQVLLISVDTLREDALSSLGGGRPTPALDRFVSESEVWSPHYAASGWTKPSHATLLTGQYGWLNGAVTGEASIERDVETLAERFRAQGFLTEGLVYDCVWLDPKWGFDRGFDRYRAVRWTLPQMTRAAADWIATHRDEPFFYFFHTFEIHSDFSRLPYEAPGVTVDTVAERFGLPDYGCREGRCASSLLEAIASGEIEPLPDEAHVLRFLYDAGVADLDDQMGKLFDALRAAGVWDDLLIVFTADHGEEFLEHGKVLHGTPWEDVVRVPLAIKWPRGAHAGERQDVPTGSVDLAPTLLHALGLPTDGLAGRPLRERAAGDPVFLYNGEWSAVIHGRMKLVYDLELQRPSLYDLAADPGEAEDLAELAPERVEILERLIDARIARDRQTLATLRGASPGDDAPGLTEEERERLRSLGYVE